MAGENTLATLNGLFKTVYAEKLIDAVPDFAILQKKVPFVSADKESGSFYAQPVALSHEAGFSYANPTGSADTVSALNAAVAGAMKEAQVYGTQVILRSQLSYASLARASNGNRKAFEKASAWKVSDMNNSARKRMELSLLYGQMSIGKVSSVSSQTITITDATWSAAIWAGSEGACIEFFDGLAASANADGSGTIQITAVDTDAKTITVSGTLTGVDSNSYIFFKGARTTTAHNDMAGLQKIISNSGSLFGIDASAYSLWKGATESSVGQISHAKIQAALSKAVNKGLMEKVVCLVPPKAWGVLNSDQAALRVFDGSYKPGKMENGGESLSFHSTNGVVEIVCHPLVKEGDAFIVPVESAVRLGAVDLSFEIPGFQDQFFQMVPGYPAVELQCMADQAIFLERPAHAVYMSGITYA